MSKKYRTREKYKANREKRLAAARGSAWQRITEHAPQCGDVCWLWDGRTMWIGGRDMVDSEHWLWGKCYGSIWHNGKKWDGHIESDDDYQPTHFMYLPEAPNHALSDGSAARSNGPRSPETTN